MARGVTLLLLLAATAAAQIIYPDELESMLAQYQGYRPYAPQNQLNEIDPSPGGLLEVYDPSADSGFQAAPPRAPPAYPSFQAAPPRAPPAYPSFQAAPSRAPPAYPGFQAAPPRAPPAPVSAPRPQSSPQAAQKAVAQGTPFDSFLPPKWRDHVINIISKGVTKFTLDMDRAIEKTTMTNSRENILFSPVSLTLTLAMVLLASGGKTFEEVAKILGLESGVDISNHSEIVHQIFGLLIQQSDREGLLQSSAPQSKFAFGLFVQDGFPIRDQFRAVSEKVYQSEVVNVDFARRARQAQKVVNDWVNAKTNGKIRSMLNDVPNPSTELIIASALYFSGEWEQHFIDGGTKRKQFSIEPNETVEVDMMFNGGKFLFYEDQTLQMIALPYKGDQVTMYVILPRAPGTAGLRQLKNDLTPELIDGLIERMVNSTCIVGLPRMKLSSTLKLQGALEALGLRSLFNPRTADLSVLSPGRNAGGQPGRNAGGRPRPTQPNLFPSRIGTGTQRDNYHRYEDRKGGYMVEQWHNGYNLKRIPGRTRRQARPLDQEFLEFLNSHQLPNYGVDELRNGQRITNPGLYADDVIHKVEMTVDERGTEAAAATSVVLDRSGDFKRLIANRPFLFFIRHDPAKVIWFWGSINQPTPYFTPAH